MQVNIEEYFHPGMQGNLAISLSWDVYAVVPLALTLLALDICHIHTSLSSRHDVSNQVLKKDPFRSLSYLTILLQNDTDPIFFNVDSLFDGFGRLHPFGPGLAVSPRKNHHNDRTMALRRFVNCCVCGNNKCFLLQSWMFQQQYHSIYLARGGKHASCSMLRESVKQQGLGRKDGKNSAGRNQPAASMEV